MKKDDYYMNYDKLIKSNCKSYQRIRAYFEEYSKFKIASNQITKYESILDSINNYNNNKNPTSISPKKLINYYSVHSRYWTIIKKLRSTKSAIKVAFLVIYDTVFPYWKVFESMLSDPVFDPYIVVIPNISRTYSH